MRLCAIFLILNIHLNHIFASPPTPPELLSEADPNLQGYECGNAFFTPLDIKNALSLARNSMDKGFRYPQKFLSPLYSESRYEEYFLYPIKNGKRIRPHVKQINTVLFFVFTRQSIKEVDLVAKVTTDEYTKCIRRYTTHLGPSHSVPENANGFLCGHEFLSDEIIHKILTQAQKKVIDDALHPIFYVGSLYPENAGYMMWPIVRSKILQKSGMAKTKPYFLILNKEMQFVDIVIKGYSKNFLRCTRSRKPPKAPASDPYSKLFVQAPKSGYICGKVFFNDGILSETAEFVSNKASSGNKNKVLVEYSGPPFNQQCLMWPLMEDGRLFKKGSKGSFRLILTPAYNVMSVAMNVNGKLKACDRRTITAKKNHDTSSYQCNDYQFSHRRLVSAAEEACVKMEFVKRNFYPANYKGPRFNLNGPYFTYPVFESEFKKFRSHPELHRVVINTNCEVVGALTTLEERLSDGSSYGPSPGSKLSKRLVKCYRLDDGPLPQGFFDNNAETAFEN